MGSATDVQPRQIDWFLARGIAVASVEYRLAPQSVSSLLFKAQVASLCKREEMDIDALSLEWPFLPEFTSKKLSSIAWTGTNSSSRSFLLSSRNRGQLGLGRESPSIPREWSLWDTVLELISRSAW